MRRRDFITLLGGTFAAWPLSARAQQSGPLPVIGFLGAASAELYRPEVAAFRQGLQGSAYVEGQNVAIDYRWAEGRADQLHALAADLVRSQVSVIATAGSPAALAAKAATTNIPIVFEMAGDPVRFGLVASLDHPSGNVTGVTNLNMEIAPKLLQLLHEVVPNARVLALLVNPDNPIAETESSEAQLAAHSLGVDLQILHASTERDFDAVFANLSRSGADGLVIAPDPLFITSGSKRLGELTVSHAVPAISCRPDFARGGGLLSYGADDRYTYHLAGIYTGRILKGEKPADLPVQQSTKVEFIINLKTAKALGIAVPLPLSGRANELIE